MNNLYLRVISAVIGIILILFVIHYGFLPFLFFLMIVNVIGLLEFYKLTEYMGHRPFKLFGIIMSVVLLFLFFINNAEVTFTNDNTIFTSMFFAVLVTVPFFFILARKSIDKGIIDFSLTVFGVLYLSWTLGHFIALRSMAPYGSHYVLFVFVVTWSVDIAGYFIGIRYGKHKIVPIVSPKKTIEGSIAGFVCAIITAVIYKLILIKTMPIKDALVLGALIGIFAQIGDFSESIIKRNANQKDSGNLIPGHGGMLDRCDSFILVVPIVYYYLRFIG
jgi:phosphatidate cytidylyltransferase